MKYKTKHSYQLEKYLINHADRHFTINELQDELKDIPVATLYRLIDKFIEEGKIRKYIIGPNSSCCFQYVKDNHCEEHFHLICERCGKLIHLHCEEVSHLLNHIEREHNFRIDTSKINLYGLCEECLKEVTR